MRDLEDRRIRGWRRGDLAGGIALSGLLAASTAAAGAGHVRAFDDDVFNAAPAVLQAADLMTGGLSVPAEYEACPSGPNPPNTVFGVSFTSGLAFIDDMLYGLEWENGGGPRIFLYRMALSGCATGTRVGAQPVGFTNLESLVYNPADGLLYSVDFDFPGHRGRLIRIDPATGLGQVAGPQMSQDVRIVGMTYDRRRDLVYAVTSAFGGTRPVELLTVDLATGVETLVGPTGTPPNSLESLAVDLSVQPPRLVAAGTQVYEIDPQTGAATLLGGSPQGTVWAMEHRSLDFVWNGAGRGTGNVWSNASNWLLNGAPDQGVPRAVDTAAVNSGSVFLDTDVTVGGLTLGGGTITGAGDLTILGPFEWTSGTLTSTARGAQPQAVCMSSANLSLPGPHTLQSRDLILTGPQQARAQRDVRASPCDAPATSTIGGMLVIEAASLIIRQVVQFLDGAVIQSSLRLTSDRNVRTRGFVIVSPTGTMLGVMDRSVEFNNVPVTSNGMVCLQDGSMVKFISLAVLGGILEGSGDVVGDVMIDGGTIRPGGDGAAGILRIIGNLILTAASLFHCDLGGPPRGGTSFDQVLVTGDAALDGTLTVEAIGGFEPSPGQEFPVVVTGVPAPRGALVPGAAPQGPRPRALSGQFAFLNTIGFGEGVDGKVEYDDTTATLVITAVAAALRPWGAMLLLAAAAGALCLAATRRRARP